MTPSRITTDRLVLRPFRSDDLDAFFDCCRNPALGNNAGWEPHTSREESEKILHEIFIGQEAIWAVTLKSSGRLIGAVGLVEDTGHSDWHARMAGYWIDEAHWGNGYATEALRAALDYGFGPMGLETVTAYTFPENRRSQRTLEKCGFRLEWRHVADRTVRPGGVQEYRHIITREAYNSISPEGLARK